MIHNSKTFNYLHSLKAKEKNDLQDFVRSSFFNKNDQLILLLDQLLHNSSPDEKTIYKCVTGKKYNEQGLRYLLSDLNLLIEEFFVQQELQKGTLRNKQMLLSNLQHRKLHKYAAQHQQNLLELTAQNPLQDADVLALKLNSEELSYRLAAAIDNRSLDTRLQNLSDSIDSYYFAIKLKYACEMINRSNVLQVDYNLHFIDEIRNFLPDSEFLKVPAISIYFHILNSLLQPDEEKHYIKLKRELKESKDRFSGDELRDMFTFAQNYCIRKLNSGQIKYLEELFSNYNYLLQEKILLVNNSISQFDFKNIVTIALRLNEFEWVKNFISANAVYLPASERKNAEIYNLSRLYYSSGQPKKALQLMQDVEFTDIYYHLDAKVLLVKIYYDSNAVETILPLFTSFANYLKRNKRVSAYQRSAYLNFLKFSGQLFNYKLFDKGDVGKIKSKLMSTENIADINWLKQKAEQLD